MNIKSEDEIKKAVDFLNKILPDELANKFFDKETVELVDEFSKNQENVVLQSSSKVQKMIEDAKNEEYAKTRKDFDTLIRQTFDLTTGQTSDKKVEDVLKEQVDLLRKSESNTDWKEKFENLTLELNSIKEEKENEIKDLQEQHKKEFDKRDIQGAINSTIEDNKEKISQSIPYKMAKNYIVTELNSRYNIQKKDDELVLLNKDNSRATDGKQFLTLDKAVNSIVSEDGLERKNNNGKTEKTTKVSVSKESDNDLMERVEARMAERGA